MDLAEKYDRIPKGFYCYSIVTIEEGGKKIHTKICPHWKMLDEKDENDKYIVFCDLIKQKSYYGDSDNLVWDQVKECGINQGEINE